MAEKGHQVLVLGIRPEFPQADRFLQPSTGAHKADWAAPFDAKMADKKFTDLREMGPQPVLPMIRSGEHAFDEGVGFDASSIRRCRPMHVSHAPAPTYMTDAVIDLFCKEPIETSSLLQ